MFDRKLTSSFLFVAALVASTNSHATILYDSITQPNAGNDPVQTGGPMGDSFSTGATAVNLTDVKMLLSGNPASGASFEVSLLSDNATHPGSLIAVLQTIADSVLTSSLAQVDVAFSPVALAANTRYWIKLSTTDNSSASWGYTTGGTGVNVSGEYSFNSHVPNGYDVRLGGYLMQVTAADAATVPEPTAFSLMGIGLVGMAFGKRKSHGLAP